ncbi:MAG TPA: hypothetical protein VGH20_20670 [Myxococcales bacterium]
MPEHADKLLPKVLSAMAALDGASAAHDRLTEQLSRATLEAVRLEEELRGIDLHDAVRLEAAAHAYADGVGAAQRLVFRLKASRDSVEHAQAALMQARKEDCHARAEMLRIELEIDAASIWDMVGRFEQQVRGRLDEHARIAEEMRFAAAAAGASGATALEASTLAPALGASGPDLWKALAGGVKQLYDKTGALPQLTAKAEPLPARDVGRHGAPPAAEAPNLASLPAQVPGRAIQPAQVRRARPASSVEISAALLQGLPLSVPTPSPAVLARAVTMPADVARPIAAARPLPAPPPPSSTGDAPFDFGRPDVAPKSTASLGTFAVRPAAWKEASAPPAPENNRGRLDKMLRNLAGMVGPRRGAARRSREK